MSVPHESHGTVHWRDEELEILKWLYEERTEGKNRGKLTLRVRGESGKEEWLIVQLNNIPERRGLSRPW